MKPLISFFALLSLAGFSFAQDKAVEINIGIDPANPMKYNIEAFEVPAGKEVKLNFENTGALPKMAGGHNVVILKKGVDMIAFASAVGLATMQNAQGLNKDYLTEEQKEQTIAFTKVLGPKEKDSITFTAPAEAGEYDFVCTFIGHFATMKGKMTVK